jgi:hypothetical protein
MRNSTIIAIMLAVLSFIFLPSFVMAAGRNSNQGFTGSLWGDSDAPSSKVKKGKGKKAKKAKSKSQGKKSKSSKSRSRK